LDCRIAAADHTGIENADCGRARNLDTDCPTRNHTRIEDAASECTADNINRGFCRENLACFAN
jgi:hypothetical protein